MKALALIAIVAVVTVSALAQQVLPPPPLPQPNYTYDCSALSSEYASPGCASYNQLVVDHDKQIMSTLKENDIKLVCFRPGADFFAVIAYSNPDTLLPDPKNPNLLHNYGFGDYISFKNGVVYSTEAFSGEWRKLKSDPTPTFLGKGFLDPHSQLVVTDTEVDYDTDYQNLNNTMTADTLQIRLSTSRFSETFSAAESQAKTAKRTQFSYNGYCAEFKKGK